MKRALLIAAYACGTGICVSAQSQPAISPTQQTGSAANPNADKMTNADVIELAGLGFSEDVIIDKIYAARATDFDTSIPALKALKAAKVSESVIRAMINPSPPSPAPPPSNAGAAESNGAEQPRPPTSEHPPTQKPRVFFQSSSHGNSWNANRDQSMEMSKDFEQDCPAAKITLAQQNADYTIALNHIEAGLLLRDNQIQVADRNGDLVSRTKEGGSIRAAMKGACSLILADWAKNTKPEPPAPRSGRVLGTAGSAPSTNSYEGDFPDLAYRAPQGWIGATTEKLAQGNEARLARVTGNVVQQHPGESSLHVIAPKALFYASPNGGGDGDQISLPSVRIMVVEWSAEPPSLDTVAHDAEEKAKQGVTLLNPPTEYKVGGQVFLRADYKDESQKPPQWECHVQTVARGYLLTLEIYAGSAEELLQAASTVTSFSVSAP